MMLTGWRDDPGGLVNGLPVRLNQNECWIGQVGVMMMMKKKRCRWMYVYGRGSGKGW